MRCFLVTRFTVVVLGVAGVATVRESVAEPVQATPVLSPERWLELSMGSPIPMAVHPEGKELVATAGCKTDVYDLVTGKKRHTWREVFTKIQYGRSGPPNKGTA